MTDIDTITVPRHLRGYPGVASGGYVAVATPDELDLEVPEPPSWDEASAAAEAYRAAPPEGAGDCFGCGLDRTPDTGLRQHCGVVPGRDLAQRPHRTADPALTDRL